MNRPSKSLTESFDRMVAATLPAIEEMDKQIAWLTRLRDAFQNLVAVSRKAMAQLESGEVELDDREEIRQFIAESKPTIPDTAGAVSPDEPVWKRIRRLMASRPTFAIRDAGEAVEAELGRSLGKNRPQTVRNNLIRHKESFRQNSDGTWTVIHSPADGINDDEVLEE